MTSTEPPVRAIFAGLSTVDIVQLVERLPAANEKVVSLDFLVAAGGPAANAAVAFAHCGGQATLVTALPDHRLASFITSDLKAAGVIVHRGGEYSGVPVTASILVTRATGERAVVSPTASPRDVLDNDSPAPSLEGVGVVLIDGYFPTICVPLARAARERGIPVILDAGSHKSHTEELLQHVDVAVVSENFAPPGVAADPVSVLAYIVDHGPTFAAVTRGPRAIAFRAPTTRGGVAVDPVTVADTLGAGDFFHGALAHAVARHGLVEANFPQDLAWASRVAGASLGTFGTRAWLTGT